MNRVLHFKQNEDKKLHIVTDLHYNHNPKWPVPLWKMRGYSSVDEMNVDIITKINKQVGPDDYLLNLGDISLNCSEDKFESLISQIVCRNIYLLWGNHNSPSWGIYQRELKKEFPILIEQEVYPFRYKNIIFVGNYLEAVIDGQYCVFQHFPSTIWNNMSKGAVHGCGHSHYSFPNTREDYKEAKILDCSWDNIKRPYTFAEFMTIMNTKGIRKVDHH